MSCPRCRDYRIMALTLIAANVSGGLVYLFVRLHLLGAF